MYSRSKHIVILFYIFIIFCFYPLHAIDKTTDTVILKSLSYSYSDLIELRKEVKENIQHRSTFHLSVVTWRKYKVRPKDNFFLIMTRTLMNHDTLATVNDLVSIYDIESGKIWWIPNVRGVARNKTEVMKDFPDIWSTKQFVVLPFDSDRVFIPFQVLSKVERKYFGLLNFIRPVIGRISSTFGVRTDPFSNKKKFHQGIDISCDIDSKVVASETGSVIFSGYKPAYGKTVIVQHRNRYRTLYAHLKNAVVKTGENVRQGQLIAFSGDTGKVTGAHLHFEVSRGKTPIKPHF